MQSWCKLALSMFHQYTISRTTASSNSKIIFVKYAQKEREKIRKISQTFIGPNLKVIVFYYISFCCDGKSFRSVSLGKVTSLFFCLENTPLKVTKIWKLNNLYPWLISNLMHKILIYSHTIHLLKSSTCFEH